MEEYDLEDIGEYNKLLNLLHKAVINNKYDKTLQLLQPGIDLKYIYDLLCLAVYNNYVDIVKLLLNYGASIDGYNLVYIYRLYMPLIFDVQSIEVLDLLYKHGANLNATYNSYTLLMTRIDDIGFVNYLLTHGADPDIVNNDGKTAIMLANEQGRMQTVKLLLKYKADPSGIVVPENTWKQSNKIKKDICAICHDELDNGSPVLQHTCTGQFHEQCIKKWNGPCPFCNLNFGKRKYKH